METYKKVIVPEREEQQVDETICDCCKKPIKIDRFDAEEVEIIHRTGNSYPECGSGEEVSFDMCKDCFENDLTEWFKSKGSEPRRRKWDC